MDWQTLFVPSVPLLEIFVRGTSIYWFLLIMFRVVLRRDVGALGMADVLVLVLIADASQNAMAGDYKSITDGLVLISTIVFWNVLVDWLGYRFPTFEKLIQPRVLCLVRDGQVLKRNMRREFITMEELMSKLREKGVASLSEVHRAYLESDGSISVLEKQAAQVITPPSSPTH